MLPAEEARARLAAVINANWRDEADARIKKLPRGHRRHARVLIEDVVYTTPGRQEQQLALRIAFATLDEMSRPDRARLLSAITPGMGDTLAAWWDFDVKGPYSVGYTRRAFRAPNNRALTVNE